MPEKLPIARQGRSEILVNEIKISHEIQYKELCGDSVIVNVVDGDYTKDLKYAYFQISEDAGKKFDGMMYGKYNDKEPIEDRKEFAEWVSTQPKHMSGILFRMFDKKDYSEIIWNLIRPEFKKL